MRSPLGLPALAAVVTTIALVVGWPISPATVVALSATTAFLMGGTAHPLVSAHELGPPVGSHPNYALSEPEFAVGYVRSTRDNFILPTAIDRGDDVAGPVGDPHAAERTDYNLVAVHTPEEFWPVFGTRNFTESVAAGVANLTGCLTGSGCTAHAFGPEELDELAGGGQGTVSIVVGYSQSAHIASVVKAGLIERYQGNWAAAEDPAPVVSFILISNPNRPNGGVLQRFAGLHIPLLDVTFDGATRTDSCDDSGCHLRTADISRQYDGWSDFPKYPLNILATINAVLGILYLHPHYVGQLNTQTMYQGSAGDTAYYLMPAHRLPILLPLEQLGIPSPILTALDAPLRVIVEWGYDRDATHVGMPTRAGLLPMNNPLDLLANLAIAIPTGWDDGISEAAGDEDFRPFGTPKPDSPYGVGGDPLPAPPPVQPAQAPGEQTEAEEVAQPRRVPRSGSDEREPDEPEPVDARESEGALSAVAARPDQSSEESTGAESAGASESARPSGTSGARRGPSPRRNGLVAGMRG